MAAAGAGWGKVALEWVRRMLQRVGPCGGLGRGAGWAGPRSETPAWGCWCAAVGRAAAAAGCGSGSCVEGGGARHSAGMAGRMRRRFYKWLITSYSSCSRDSGICQKCEFNELTWDPQSIRFSRYFGRQTGNAVRKYTLTLCCGNKQLPWKHTLTQETLRSSGLMVSAQLHRLCPAESKQPGWRLSH